MYFHSVNAIWAINFNHNKQHSSVSCLVSVLMPTARYHYTAKWRPAYMSATLVQLYKFTFYLLTYSVHLTETLLNVPNVTMHSSLVTLSHQHSTVSVPVPVVNYLTPMCKAFTHSLIHSFNHSMKQIFVDEILSQIVTIRWQLLLFALHWESKAYFSLFRTWLRSSPIAWRSGKW